ncbi:MAG: hypothetical protein P8090_17365 [Gammaproteobacteria bacterium]
MLGQATTNLDTNRSSLLKALNTKYERYTNLTCPVGYGVSDFQFTKDEGAAFFRVAYASTTSQFQEGIYEVSPDGSDFHTVVPASWFGDPYPERLLIAPDGSRAFFRRLGYDPTVGSNVDELWMVDADGSHLRKLADTTAPNSTASPPVFVSPDGKTVYVSDGTYIGSFSVDSPGTEQTIYTGTQSMYGVQSMSLGPFRCRAASVSGTWALPSGHRTARSLPRVSTQAVAMVMV